MNLGLFAILLAAFPSPALDESFDAISDGGLPAGWHVVDGTWHVRDGRLSGNTGSILFGNAMRDVAIEADVAFERARNPTRWAALLVREDASPGVQLTARFDPDRRDGLELAARRAPRGDAPDGAGGDWRIFQTARAKIAFDGPARFHRLRIEARGDWVRGYVDGTRYLQCRRGGSVSPRGRVGFRVDGATALFDNVKVFAMKPLSKVERHALRARPLVVAHRGFSSRAPENTLAAYRAAIELGVELAECDVRFSKDRIPVLLHDDNLRRTASVDKRVDELTASELAEHDVPSLRDALRLVKGKIRFVIEIKDRAMEEAVVADIRATKTDPVDVVIFAFDFDTVRRIVELEPTLPATWLVGEPPSQPDERKALIRKALGARLSSLGFPRTHVDPEFVRLAHECGLTVFVWTVNDEEEMRAIAAAGVDAIISDDPDVALRILSEG